MPLDYSDPATQKFLIECNNTASEQRTLWFLKHKEELIRRTQPKENQKDYTTEQIEETRLEAELLALSNQHKESAHHRRNCVLTGATDTTAFSFVKGEDLAVMKPVDIKESSILYTELGAGGGRKAYLKARKYKLPEDKYNDCLTTNNVYGWALSDSSVKSGAPEHKRYETFFRSLTRQSGVHPDPPHYKSPSR